MTLAYIYYRFRGLKIVHGVLNGLRPAVIALIASAGISLTILIFYGQRELPANLLSIDKISVAIFVVGLLILRMWKVNPIHVMLGAGIIGIILFSIF